MQNGASMHNSRPSQSAAGGSKSQMNRVGINTNLYDKRGRNSKGQAMFHHLGPNSQFNENFAVL